MHSVSGAPVALAGSDAGWAGSSAGFRFTALPPDCDEVKGVCVCVCASPFPLQPCVGMVFLVEKQLLLGFPLIKPSFSEF